MHVISVYWIQMQSTKYIIFVYEIKMHSTEYNFGLLNTNLKYWIKFWFVECKLIIQSNEYNFSLLNTNAKYWIII